MERNVRSHLISLSDLSQEDLWHIISRAAELALAHQTAPRQTLAGKTVGSYFRKTSTRTRTSFLVAAAKLGAYTIAYGPADLQICTGESIEDTARVLGGYLDALVIRTAADPAELRRMARMNYLSIINAMTSDEHPTQALSDLATLKRRFGELAGLHVLYVGEGNNTAAALALAAARIKGLRITFLTPEGYGISPEIMARARSLGRESGGEVEEFHNMSSAPAHVDAVYTTRWQTTGTEKSDIYWRERFAPFCVTQELMERVSKHTGTVFLHDLPAVRGEDSSSHVLDGPQSIVFDQARQKLFTAMAILEWCIL